MRGETVCQVFIEIPSFFSTRWLGKMMSFRLFLLEAMASSHIEIDTHTHREKNDDRRRCLLWRKFFNLDSRIFRRFTLIRFSVRPSRSPFVYQARGNEIVSLLLFQRKNECERERRGWRNAMPEVLKSCQTAETYFIRSHFSDSLKSHTKRTYDKFSPPSVSLRRWNLFRSLAKGNCRFQLKFFQLLLPSQADYEDTLLNSARSILSASITSSVSSLSLSATSTSTPSSPSPFSISFLLVLCLRDPIVDSLCFPLTK